MNSKLLSVIIPAYNAEKYLAKCVESVAEQSYKNIEIVIVNNGSSDSTPEICEELRAKYNNRIFKIINLKPNQGINFARRAGVENASGDYIAFIDSDDYLELKTYETAIKVLEENDCDMVQFGYYAVYPDGRLICEIADPPAVFNNSHDAFKYVIDLLQTHTILVWDKVYKRGLFDNLEWPKISGHEDFCMGFQIFAKVKNFTVIKDILYYHVERIESTSYTPLNKKSRIYNDLEAVKFISAFADRAVSGFIPEVLYYALSVILSIITSNILSVDQEIMDLLNNQYFYFFKIDYESMYAELKRQRRNLYTKPITLRQRIILWCISYMPKFYRVYLKTRLKIKALTGI